MYRETGDWAYSGEFTEIKKIINMHKHLWVNRHWVTPYMIFITKKKSNVVLYLSILQLIFIKILEFKYFKLYEF